MGPSHESWGSEIAPAIVTELMHMHFGTYVERARQRLQIEGSQVKFNSKMHFMIEWKAPLHIFCIDNRREVW